MNWQFGRKVEYLLQRNVQITIWLITSWPGTQILHWNIHVFMFESNIEGKIQICFRYGFPILDCYSSSSIFGGEMQIFSDNSKTNHLLAWRLKLQQAGIPWETNIYPTWPLRQNIQCPVDIKPHFSSLKRLPFFGFNALAGDWAENAFLFDCLWPQMTSFAIIHDGRRCWAHLSSGSSL